MSHNDYVGRHSTGSAVSNLLFVSVERFVSVFRPHLVKVIFNETKATVYTAIIIIMLLAFNIYVVVYDVSIRKLPNGIQRCHLDQTPRLFVCQINFFSVLKDSYLYSDHILLMSFSTKQKLQFTL